ncbi:hypothetical protein TNCV_3120831 [Trichonephila clavipes]|nr:hypothetical protein TNCV_3120831 [Trichonephila clavipes]
MKILKKFEQASDNDSVKTKTAVLPHSSHFSCISLPLTSEYLQNWHVTFRVINSNLQMKLNLPLPQIQVSPYGKEIYGHHGHSKQRDGRDESHTERIVLHEFPGLIYTRSQQCITIHGDYFEEQSLGPYWRKTLVIDFLYLLLIPISLDHPGSFALQKSDNRLVPGPDCMVNVLKLPNQIPRVSGESLQTCVAWRCPDGTQHIFCWPILAISGQLLASNGTVVDISDLNSWVMLWQLTCRLTLITYMILSTFSTTGLPVRSASLTSKMPERNRRNQNCTKLAVTLSAS